MTLAIESSRLERLTSQLVRRAGKSLSDVLEDVLGIQRSDEPDSRTWEEFRAGIEQIQARIAAQPQLDSRSDDEIIGYDEDGLPR